MKKNKAKLVITILGIVIVSNFIYSCVSTNEKMISNLAPNPGFEQGMGDCVSSYKGMLVWSNENPHSGQMCIEQEYELGAHWNCIQSQPPFIKCKPGEFYRLSIWNKNTVPAGNVAMGIRFINDQKKTVSYQWKNLVQNNNKWDQYSMTFEVPKFTVAMAIYMRVGAMVQTGRVFWDDVVLEKTAKLIKAMQVEPLKATVFFRDKQGRFVENPIFDYKSQKFYDIKPDDVKVHLKFTDEQVLPASLNYRLERAYSHDVVQQKSIRISSMRDGLTIDPEISVLPMGHYMLKVELKKDDGTLAGEYRRLLAVLPAYEFPKLEPVKKVTIDGAQVKVNNKPFLAINFYHPILNQEYSQGIRSFGENVKQVWAGTHDVDKAIADLRKILDLCKKNNCYAYIVMHTAWALDRKAKKFNLANIKKAVRALKAHPALFMWSIVDEPDALKIPQPEVLKVYQLLKHMDPDHPVIVNLCKPKMFKTYAPSTDIASYDHYPNPGDVATSYYWNKNILAASKKVKPLKCILQTYSRPGTKLPSREWLRAQVYLCITQGMELFYYYAFRDPAPLVSLSMEPELQSYAKAINMELSQLRNVITSPSMEVPDAIALKKHGLHCTLRQVGMEKYLIAVNVDESPKRATIKVPKVKDGKVNLLFEDGRKIGLKNGSIEDDFAPLQVHVYRIN